MKAYLDGKGVEFITNRTVTDLDFEESDDMTVTAIHFTSDGVRDDYLQLHEGDLCPVTPHAKKLKIKPKAVRTSYREELGKKKRIHEFLTTTAPIAVLFRKRAGNIFPASMRLSWSSGSA